MALGVIRELLRFELFLALLKVFWQVLVSLFPFLVKEKRLRVCGKCVLVTGGSRGVGEELVHEFAQLEPSKIIIVSRSSTTLRSLCRRLSNDFENIKFHFYACDLGDKVQVSQLTRTIKTEHGYPHIIVCNAGIVTSGKTIEETSDKELEYTFQVNTLSHFTIIRDFLKPMIASEEECQIVQVLSLLSFFALPRLGSYSSSKAASFLFSDALRAELGMLTRKVRLTTIHPYLINTSMFSSAKLRYSYLMSPLKASYVAKETVKAAIRRRECVILPKYMTLLPIIKNFLPVRVWLSMMSLGDPYSFAEALPNKL